MCIPSGKKQEDGLIVENGPGAVAMATIHQDGHDAHLSEETMVDGNEKHTSKMSACQNILDAEVPKNKEDIVEDTVSQDGTLEPSTPLDGSDDLLASEISDSPMGVTSRTLLCNRVRVYPCKPDMVLPKSATLLPFSDDMWVAVILDISNHEDVYQEDGSAIESNGNTVGLASIQKEILVNGEATSTSQIHLFISWTLRLLKTPFLWMRPLYLP